MLCFMGDLIVNSHIIIGMEDICTGLSWYGNKLCDFVILKLQFYSIYYISSKVIARNGGCLVVWECSPTCSTNSEPHDFGVRRPGT
jgi:hypothetical protein